MLELLHAVQNPQRLRLERAAAERALWLLGHPAVQALPAKDVAARARRRLPSRREAERADVRGCSVRVLLRLLRRR